MRPLSLFLLAAAVMGAGTPSGRTMTHSVGEISAIQGGNGTVKRVDGTVLRAARNLPIYSGDVVTAGTATIIDIRFRQGAGTKRIAPGQSWTVDITPPDLDSGAGTSNPGPGESLEIEITNEPRSIIYILLPIVILLVAGGTVTILILLRRRRVEGVEGLLDLGFADYSDGDYEQAVETFSRAIAKAESTGASIAKTAEATAWLAYAQIAAGQAIVGKETMNRALGMDAEVVERIGQNVRAHGKRVVNEWLEKE